jgi:uncharacterized circularly permuted ATP-grasp superfamily protein
MANTGLFEGYDTGGFYDEMFLSPGHPRPHYAKLFHRLAKMAPAQFEERRKLADLSFLIQGITFTVYSDGRGTERLFPFDLVPRIIPSSEWARVDRGLSQRVIALNLFLQDVYGQQCIFRDKRIPRSLVYSCPAFRREVVGVDVPRGIHTHICGIDLVRDSKTGEYCVLEDNVRTPSGVSYVLENRLVMTRTLPDAFQAYEVLPVNHYPAELSRILRSLSPRGEGNAQIVLLTPGIYNSAYFEHSFLAQQMGIELVEGRDLIVDGGIVYMKTIRGLMRVDVIYRRVDDDFLDSLTFRPDSILGVPGLMGAYRAGNVALANAVGNGVADDKAIYAYVPAMIEFYLGEKPKLAQIPTWICAERDQRDYVLANLADMVVKPIDGLGGSGVLIGPEASDAALAARRRELVTQPERFIAQELVALSTHPTFDGDGIYPHHVDLRAFVHLRATSDASVSAHVLPAALTRVASRGSRIVNSSSGGGSKVTWILTAPDAGAA